MPLMPTEEELRREIEAQKELFNPNRSLDTVGQRKVVERVPNALECGACFQGSGKIKDVFVF